VHHAAPYDCGWVKINAYETLTGGGLWFRFRFQTQVFAFVLDIGFVPFANRRYDF
jgi:hypothetical protein